MDEIENRGEGIRPDQVEAVQSIVRSFEKTGAKTNCVIAFGSRVAESAEPESDLDVFFLVDFDAVDPASTKDGTLLIAKYQGQATTKKSGAAGDIRLFLYNQNGLAEKLKDPGVISSKLFTGVAQGLVIHGEEPEIEGLPLREYIKSRLENK